MNVLSLFGSLLLGAGFLGGQAAAAAELGHVLSEPLYLDAMPQRIERAGVIALTPHDLFNDSAGFGWTKAPTEAFAHPEFSGVRSAPLQDGVAGRDFTLRANLQAGRWTLLVFLDDGYVNAHTVQIEIDGRVQPHSQRRYGLSAEPEKLPINRFRVAQFQFRANGPVEIRFQHSAVPARLLAIQLLPMDWEEDETTRWFHRQVEDAGRHPFRASLEILRAQLTQPRKKPNAIASAAYWKAQLDILDDAEHWHRTAGWDQVSARTRSSMFTRYKIALGEIDALVEHPDMETFALRDRALWLRTRLLYWLWLEQHQADDEAAFNSDIDLLRSRYPRDRLVAMYAGEKIPVADDLAAFSARPNAPAWSTAQFEALQRLRDVAHYWINERQIPNGEFGGKTDDDVELLRWWPVLMLSGDQKAREGFRRLADGVWFSPRMNLGYSKAANDVEHSAEFVADTVPMMALMKPESEWISRLGWSYRHMRDLWTGRNARGELMFKSAWIGATEILSEPPRNRDVSMNARAAKAVRYHAWLAGDAEATRMLHDWSRAWAGAAARTDKGKPRGLFPASIRWPDGAVNGDEPSWHESKMFWSYFDWTGDGRLYDQLLFSWLGTQDATLLAPLRDTLGFLQERATTAARARESAGSADWAAARLMRSSEFWNVVAQWRLETNDASFDPFLLQYGPAYLRFRLTGDATAMATTIDSTLLSVLRFNRPMRTSEVLFTDRVFVSRREGSVDGVDLLAAMLTGCHTAQGLSPYYHAAWDEAPETFTALVTAAGPDRFAADLFVHQAEKARIAVRLFRLSPGDYRVIVRTAQGVVTDRLESIGNRTQRISLEVPGSVLVSIQITPANKTASSSP